MKLRHFNTRQLALTAVLAAMCTVLGGISLRLGGNFEFTFESVPVHIGALLFGPIEGAFIGGIGTFIYQVLLSGYGISATTPLWILPYVVCGLIVGVLTRRDKERSYTHLALIILAAELSITLLNTLALAVDALIYGYYSPAFIFGTLALRLVICVIKAVAYAAILPKLMHPLKTFTKRA